MADTYLSYSPLAGSGGGGDELWQRISTTLSPINANDNVSIGTGLYTGGNLDINALAASSQNPSILRTGPDSIAAEIDFGSTDSAAHTTTIRSIITDTTGANNVGNILRARGSASTRFASVRAGCNADVATLSLAAERPGVSNEILMSANSANAITYAGTPADLTTGTAHKFSTVGAISSTGKIVSFQNNGVEVMAHNANSLVLIKAFTPKRTATAASASSAQETIIGVTSTAAARTITLDDDDKIAGRIIIVKDESGAAGTNNITVQAETGNIDGGASVAISANYGVCRVYSDGTNWFTW